MAPRRRRTGKPRIGAASGPSEQLAREVIENAALGIFVLDRDGRHVLWNPFMEQLTGLAAEQVLGRRAIDLFPELRTDGSSELIERALQGERVATPDRPYHVAATGRSGWISANYAPHRDAQGNIVGMVGFVSDVTERTRLEERLERYAFYDSLTGLPNRAAFIDRLEQALATADRRGTATAVLFLDLDNFKLINDGFGHAAGDDVLVQTGRRLRGCLRAGDTVARLGGDEFTALLEDIENPGDAVLAAERILLALAAPYEIGEVGETKRRVTVSIGIAVSARGRHQAQDLLRRADVALYRAKADGKDCYRAFSAEMSIEPAEQRAVEEASRGGLHQLYEPEVTGFVVDRLR